MIRGFHRGFLSTYWSIVLYAFWYIDGELHGWVGTEIQSQDSRMDKLSGFGANGNTTHAPKIGELTNVPK